VFRPPSRLAIRSEREIMIAIAEIELPVDGFEKLRIEARAEGHDFIERLAEQWASGENRFFAPGEVLLGYFDRGQLVAVGGLNRDPYASDPTVGRVRRIYVRPAWRQRGIGRALVAQIVVKARSNFSCLRLRAMNPGASRLYEGLGFVPIDDPHSTHILRFDPARREA
jgi:GNAT superfamily N-acetyltransferase